MQPASRAAPRTCSHLFKESEWFEFLSLLGLVCSVDCDQFVEFVRSVAAEGQTASALTKSKVLVGHLLSSPELLALDAVSSVAFLQPERVSPALSSICPQHGDVDGSLALMAFRDAVPSRHEKLCWTTASLLPAWADPARPSSSGAAQLDEDWVTTRLGVQRQPNVATVVRHLETVCDAGRLLSAPASVKVCLKARSQQVSSTELNSSWRTAASQLRDA